MNRCVSASLDCVADARDELGRRERLDLGRPAAQGVERARRRRREDRAGLRQAPAQQARRRHPPAHLRHHRAPRRLPHGPGRGRVSPRAGYLGRTTLEIAPSVLTPPRAGPPPPSWPPAALPPTHPGPTGGSAPACRTGGNPGRRSLMVQRQRWLAAESRRDVLLDDAPGRNKPRPDDIVRQIDHAAIHIPHALARASGLRYRRASA